MNDRNETKVRATVAQGRTVVAADPANQVVIGYDSEGKAIRRARSIIFSPGQEVELPADEVKRLRKVGFLVDPNASAPPRGEGPSFTEQGARKAA